MAAFAALLGLLLAWNLRPQERRGGPSIMPYSALLAWDLPGAAPHDQRMMATARVRQSAASRGLRCDVVEVYRTAAPELVRGALEEAQAERHYLRYKDRQNPALSRWDGPNQLWMVEGREELLLCLLGVPAVG